MTNTQMQTQNTRFLPTWLVSVVVLAGPALCVAFLVKSAGSSWLPADALAPVLWGALFMWSPQPLSIPALLTQDGRDGALPAYRGVVKSALRGVLLVPYLLSSKSTVRVETAASLVGLAVGFALAAGHL